MNTAEVIDLRDYRARREARSSRPSPASECVAQSFMVFPVPVLVGWLPFWFVMGVPMTTGSRDA